MLLHIQWSLVPEQTIVVRRSNIFSKIQRIACCVHCNPQRPSACPRPAVMQARLMRRPLTAEEKALRKSAAEAKSRDARRQIAEKELRAVGAAAAEQQSLALRTAHQSPYRRSLIRAPLDQGAQSLWGTWHNRFHPRLNQYFFHHLRKVKKMKR